MNFILPHLPVLQVAIPLIAAPICVLFTFGGHRKLAWLFTLAISWVCFLIAVALLSRVLFVRRSQRTSMWLRRCSPSLEYQSRLKLTGAASANSSSSPDLSMNGLLSSTNTTGTHLSHILLQRLLFAMNVSNSSNITVYGILTSYMIWRPTRKRLQI